MNRGQAMLLAPHAARLHSLWAPGGTVWAILVILSLLAVFVTAAAIVDSQGGVPVSKSKSSGGGVKVLVAGAIALALASGLKHHHGHDHAILTSASGASTSSSNEQLGMAMAARRGWTGGQASCLNWLWTRESGWQMVWNTAGSGAYGIPQSLPASKMASAGSDYMTNPRTQIRWGLGYIRGRYGDPCNAWAHEESHSWY